MNQRDVDREIIISCVLGDGCLVYHSQQGTAWLKLSHCQRQKEYLLWKLELVESTLVAKGRTFTVRDVVNRHSNGKSYPVCTANMYGVKYFRILRKWIYPAGKKTYRYVLKYLKTPLALAIMLMDDGCEHVNRRRHKDGSVYFSQPTIRWGLCRPIDDCAEVLAWLQNRFGVDGSLSVHSRKDADVDYFIINFSPANTKKVWELIAPFVMQFDCMQTKFARCIKAYSESLPRVARVPGTSPSEVERWSDTPAKAGELA